jgi:hypothetical protein
MPGLFQMTTISLHYLIPAACAMYLGKSVIGLFTNMIKIRTPK